MFRLVHLAHAGGEHVACREIEIVTRSVKIGRNRRNEVVAILHEIGLAKLQPGDFRDRIPLVRRLQRPRKQ